MRITRRKLTAATAVPAAVLGIGLSAGQAASAATSVAPVHVTAAAAYQQAQPWRGEALSTMRTYYQDINVHNYAGAWLLWSRTGGTNAVGQSFREFVAGYRTTAHVSIHPYRELRTAGFDRVYLTIVATQTNGSAITYNGWYMVNGRGLITMMHVVQTGVISAPVRHHHARAPFPPPTTARAAWLALANDSTAGLGAGYLQVAGDLPSSDAPQIGELNQLSQIPATMATPQQMQEAQADVTGLNAFFNTPGFTP
jgi:hypothetical protein